VFVIIANKLRVKDKSLISNRYSRQSIDIIFGRRQFAVEQLDFSLNVSEN